MENGRKAELRSEKVRNMLGDIPSKLTIIGTLVIIISVITGVLVLSLLLCQFN